MSFSSRNSMSSGSSRLGVQHMIDEGFRYPSLTELNGGQSMLYTPVHPGFDILWSSKRKWAVCLWSTLMLLFLLIFQPFRYHKRKSIKETVSIIIVLFWISVAFCSCAITVKFLMMSPTYAKCIYERWVSTYNTVSLFVMRMGDRLDSILEKCRRKRKGNKKTEKKKKVKDKNNNNMKKGGNRRMTNSSRFMKYTNKSEDKYKMERAINESENIELMHKDDDFDGFGNLEYKDESESGTDFDDSNRSGIVNV